MKMSASVTCVGPWGCAGCAGAGAGAPKRPPVAGVVPPKRLVLELAEGERGGGGVDRARLLRIGK